MKIALKLASICALLALFATGALAQGVRYDNIVIGPTGHAIGGATITVCTSSATGTPCSPTTPIYTDATLGTTTPSSFQADQNGNYGFWIAPGTYKLTITGTGITPQTMTITPGCIPGATGCASGGSGTVATGTVGNCAQYTASTTVGSTGSPCGTGSSSLNINGSAVSNPNLNSTSPAVDSGFVAATMKVQGSNAIAEVSLPGVAPNQNVIYVSPNCGTQTNCFPVKDDAQFVWGSATYTAGSPNVACPACNFTSADAGKIFFATNAAYHGFFEQVTSVVTCGQTTIQSVTDSHDIVLAANCGSSSSTGTPIIWGSDDSAALASAWTATVGRCGVLQLPGGNAEGNGPAALLIQQAEFNTASTVPPTIATCSLGSEATRQGLGVVGVTTGSTFIIPTPNFNLTTCTFGLSGAGCLFSINDGATLQNFTVWGGAVSSPSGASTHNVIDLNAQTGVSPTSGANAIRNVVLQGWGAGASGFLNCLLLQGGTTVLVGLTVDGCGQVGMNVAGGYQSATGLALFDNFSQNLRVTGVATHFTSTGGQFGFTNASDCNVGVDAGGVLVSIGDHIGLGIPKGSNLNGLCVGFTFGGGNSAGTAIVNGSNIDLGTTTGGVGAFVNVAGVLYMEGSSLNASGTSATGLFNSGKYFDLGGNTITGTTAYASTGKVFGSASITGTVQTAANITPSTGWGTTGAAGNGVSAVSGATRSELLTITSAGTPTANPTIAIVFPTAFLVAPTYCVATQIGGTGAIQPLTTTTGPSATGVTFTWNGTPVAAKTYVINVSCNNN